MFIAPEIGLTNLGQLTLAVIAAITYLSCLSFIMNTHIDKEGFPTKYDKTPFLGAALYSLVSTLVIVMVSALGMKVLPPMVFITIIIILPASYFLWGRD